MRTKKKNRIGAGNKFIVGIDEVGRGSLAGPVAVAAFCIPKGTSIRNNKLGKLRDSKKLSAKQREAWFDFLKDYPRAHYAVARVYPRQIEKRNISRAANLAAQRACTRLLAQCQVSGARCQVFLDGGLYLGNKTKNIRVYRRNNPRLPSPDGSGRMAGTARLSACMTVRTVIRGDEKIKVIAMASIVAKVLRDRGMVKMAKKYPRYGFEIHKGYGTKAHLAAIRKYGASSFHRSTFLRSC